MILKMKDNIEFEISEEDFEMVNSFVWHKAGNYIRNSKGQWLHRLITNCPKGLEVDHIDRNPLNNKRENLRCVTRAENNRNKRQYNKYPNKSTGIYGIDAVKSRRKDGKPYFRVRINGLKANKFSKLISAIKYRNKYLMEHKEEFDGELFS